MTHKLSKEIESAKKPMINTLLRLENAQYLFDNLKDFLNKKNKFSEDWNPLNVLSCDAATVGLYKFRGKIQKAFKASYPPGDAKEDWQIINELAEFMNNRKLFNDKEELDSSMLNYLKLQSEKQTEQNNNNSNSDFNNENLKIEIKDYYFSNVVAKSSKTMIECNNAKMNLKSTGTEG